MHPITAVQRDNAVPWVCSVPARGAERRNVESDPRHPGPLVIYSIPVPPTLRVGQEVIVTREIDELEEDGPSPSYYATLLALGANRALVRRAAEGRIEDVARQDIFPKLGVLEDDQ